MKTDADLRNANERAAEWESIAASRRAALEWAKARVKELEAQQPYKLLKCHEDTNGEWVPNPQRCTMPPGDGGCPEPGEPCEECSYYA